MPRVPSVLLAVLLVPLAARQEPAPAPSKQAFGATTAAVMVDVVVRDKKGNPITDLRKEDFALFEDGVRQDIGDVTLVAPPSGRIASSREEIASAADRSTRTSGSSTPSATQTFVALVFDRLSPEARVLAHKGALAYLDTNNEGEFAGVFLSDLSLVTIQTFTNDRAKVRAAIDDVASRATSNFDRLRIAPGGSGDFDPGTPPTASADSVGQASPNDPALTHTVDPGMQNKSDPIGMIRRMERTFEAMSRDQQGHTTTNSLLAVIDALGQLPGRKTVVFFAEALAIPANVQARFESVVAMANRLNVSVYSVDAAGLRVHSGQTETARRVNSLGALALERDPEKPDGKLTEALEVNEDVLRRDPAVSLRLLADRTGGFLVNNTNDLARGFRDIETDRRFHYLLTYTPSNGNFNGEWRTLSVKVPSRTVYVRARVGYLAVRTPGAIPMLTYEGPALAALDHRPLPHDVPVRAVALVFPDKAESRLAVLAGTPGAALTFTRDEKANSYRTDFTILARIKNASGEVVRKASQPYRLSGPLDKVDEARRGDVLFFRQPTLAPGTYTLDVVVHDALARRAGVQTSTFTVPERTGVQVSSLILVQRGERLPASEPANDNPLRVGDVLLYPNLGEPVRRSETATLYFALTPGPGATPQADLEVLSDAAPPTRVPLTLDAPDAHGVIHQLARLPLAALAPGSYTLRLTVHQGEATATRDAPLVIVP
jgi:VWFA-related protein